MENSNIEEQRIKEELIRRYKYLATNKELILSLCIREGVEENKLKRHLKEIKASLASYKKAGLNNLLAISLMSELIEQTKKDLNSPRLYVMDNIPRELLNRIEQFLFTDEPLDTTALYQEIESIKSDEVEMAVADYSIEEINRIRAMSTFLRNRPIFTVWHILDYVRVNHPHNLDIQEFLDIFYNIERTVLTGLNWESGYYLDPFDEEDHKSYIEAYPYYITSGVKTSYDESYVLTSYKGNEFEHEDEYFTPIYETVRPKVVNDYPTMFVYHAISLAPFTKEEKNKIFVELQGETKKLKHEEK